MRLDNKMTGIIIIILGVLMLPVLASLTIELGKANEILHADCPLPEDVCPLHTTLPAQSVIGFTLSGLIIVFGLILVFTSRKEQIVEEEKSERVKKILKTLEPDEKKVYDLVAESGTIFQSEFMEKTGFSKVKITRILDKLEAKGLVERRRRGMTNVVMLKR